MNQNINLLSNIFQFDNKVILDISSELPSRIEEILYQHKQFTTIILYNTDVWRYQTEFLEIQQKFLNNRIIIITPGYYNYNFNNKHYELSLPLYYWKRYRSTEPFSAKPTNLEFGFGSLNNRPSTPRLLLGYQLYQKNLLSNIIFTLNNVDSKYADDIYSCREFDNAREYINHTNFENFVSLLPIQWKNNNIKYQDHSATEDAESLAYSNITVETEVQDWPYHRFINRPMVSEKTWKPFISGQVPVLLAPAGHLAYIKSLGFETLDSLYPIDYDNMPIASKIEAITDIVSKGKDFMHEFYFKHIKEIQHNYELVMSNTVEEILINKVKELLK